MEFIFGLIIGIIIAKLFKPEIMGILHVHGSELYLATDELPEDFATKRYVTFRISRK